MSLFSFKRLIKKYSKSPPYQLKETEGYNDMDQGGIWVPGITEEIEIEDAAVIPLSNEDLNFGEGGTYSTEDRKLYCYVDMEKGTKIKHKDIEYTILGRKDYEDFDDGLFIYILGRGGRSD